MKFYDIFSPPQKVIILLLIFSACSHNKNPSAPVLNDDNYWQSTNGPYGGSISVVSMDSKGDLFAGTNSGAVFRSMDNGDSWLNLGIDFEGTVYVIAFDAESNIYISAGHEFIKSDDGGKNWKEIEIDLLGPVTEFAISSAGYILVGGVYLARSTDNGVTWEQVSPPSGRLNSLKFNSNDHLFFGDAGNGLYRSMDLGDTWTKVSPDSVNPFVEAIVEKSNGELLIGVRGATYLANSGGENWQKILAASGNHIALNSSGHIFVADREGEFFRSEDNGKSWEALDTGIDYPEYREVFITPKNDIFVGTYDGERGLLRSTDNGDTFEEVNEGISSTRIEALVVDASDGIYATTKRGRLFYSNDHAQNWMDLGDKLPENVRTLVINSKGNIIAGADYGGIIKSEDRGHNWVKINDEGISYFIIDLNDYLYGIKQGEDAVFRSVDNGYSWVLINDGLNRTKVRCLGADLEDNIYAGTENGVFYFEENSTKWEELPHGLTNPSNIITLAFDSDSDIFASDIQSNVFHYDKKESNWTQTTLDIGNFIVTQLEVYKGQIFAGSMLGVYTSPDKGETWIEINSGLHNPSVTAFGFDSMGYVYVGNFNGGVSRSNRAINR